MRELTENEIVSVAGGNGTRGHRDGERGAAIGTAILGLIMSFQDNRVGTKSTATAFGTNVYYQAK